MKQQTILFTTIFVLLTTLFSSNVNAQIWNKVNPFNKNASEELIVTPEDVAQMRKDMVYLTSENTKGRQAGTKGEEVAGMYIEQRMAAIGLQPIAPKRYRQAFTYRGANKLGKDCKITIGKNHIFMPEEAIPAPFSAEGNEENFVMPESEEANAPWLVQLYNNKFEAQNGKFDWEHAAYQKAKYAEERGASAVILYDNFNAINKPRHSHQSSYKKLSIPVIVVFYESYNKYIKPLRLITPVTININYQKEIHTSVNILGYVNNNAPTTIVLTAYYDHLGINGTNYFPGANENASGVVALLNIANKLKNAQLSKYNYMVVALSAHEYDMNGIKTLIKSDLFKSKKIAALINFNSVGRLKPNRELFIEGIASGNNWEKLIENAPKNIKIKPSLDLKTKSDELIAYQNKIPVLLITTGPFDDKRQLTDLPSKINFKGMEEISNFSLQLLVQLNNNIAPKYTDINNVIKRKNEEAARIEAQKIAREKMQKEQQEKAKILAIEKELQNEKARIAAQRRDSIMNATNNKNAISNNKNAKYYEQQAMRDSLIKVRELDQAKKDSLITAREEKQTQLRLEREAAAKHRNEVLAKQKEANEAKKQAALKAAQEKAEKEAKIKDLQIKNAQEEGVLVLDTVMYLKDVIGIKLVPKHNQGGVKIGSITVNYAAQKAGFKKGDIIIQIGNQMIKDSKEYEKTIASTLTNKTIYVKLRREGKLMQLPLKFKLDNL